MTFQRQSKTNPRYYLCFSLIPFRLAKYISNKIGSTCTLLIRNRIIVCRSYKKFHLWSIRVVIKVRYVQKSTHVRHWRINKGMYPRNCTISFSRSPSHSSLYLHNILTEEKIIISPSLLQYI